VLTLYEAETVHDARQLDRHRGMARLLAETTEAERIDQPSHIGSARTTRTGAFSIILGVGTSVWVGASGARYFPSRGDPRDVAGALLVERRGYASLVFDTKDARWRERADGKLIDTVDVGTIRLARLRPRPVRLAPE